MTCEPAPPVRLGVVGLGRAFVLMLPAFHDKARIRLVAACAPREASRRHFCDMFGARGYADISGLLDDPDVEAVYIATPHQLHVEHAVAAARAGKHILLDKPLAISMEDGRRIVETAEASGVQLIVGPSHSFDAPVRQARMLIDSGAFGPVRMIQALNYTDFLYRPRRPEELRTRDGGGVIFSQAIHQIDIVRLLAGGRGRAVMALTGAWDPVRQTEGAYSALLSFEDGCSASLVYSGYAHFDSDVWMDGISELGGRKDMATYGRARLALSAAPTVEDEIDLKRERSFGPHTRTLAPDTHEHFGPIIVLCERADLRLTPFGVHIYADRHQEFRPAPPLRYGRAEVVDALVAALRHGRAPTQNGRWGLASLEVCHAILQSAATQNPVCLREQVAYRKGDAS